MPTKKYEILLDNKVIDTSYSYLSFCSVLDYYTRIYSELGRVTTKITDLV